MNKKCKKDYIDFQDEELLTADEVMSLNFTSMSSLKKIEMIADKLGQRIAIDDDTIYINYKDDYIKTDISGDDVHKYVTMMLRKFLARSSDYNNDTEYNCDELLKSLDDLEYLLMWDEESDEEIDEETDEDSDEEFEPYAKTTVSSVQEIIDFI